MFNTILLLAAFTPVISPNETDSTIAHKVDLDEVTVTEFKQNKHNLTPSSIIFSFCIHYVLNTKTKGYK